MIRFPNVTRQREPKLPGMSIRQYAQFSERCLKSNSRITPGNCMKRRADEASIRHPFVLKNT